MPSTATPLPRTTREKTLICLMLQQSKYLTDMPQDLSPKKLSKAGLLWKRRTISWRWYSILVKHIKKYYIWCFLHFFYMYYRNEFLNEWCIKASMLSKNTSVITSVAMKLYIYHNICYHKFDIIPPSSSTIIIHHHQRHHEVVSWQAVRATKFASDKGTLGPSPPTIQFQFSS